MEAVSPRKQERENGGPKTTQNKKEVKTTAFSPPGVGGVLHVEAPRRLSRPALPGRSAASLAGCFWQFDKETHHQRASLSAVCSTANRRCQRQKALNSVLYS